MLSRSTWLHLRIPFSYFLLPVYLFAASLSDTANVGALIASFVIIHFLLYPASNAYNSYFDKDEKSIGGLKNPPPVKKELYYTSLVMDGVAVAAGWITINVTFAALLLIYGIISKMYSHPAVRLKKYPVAGWLVTGFFQGFFTFLMCCIGISNTTFLTVSVPPVLCAGALTSLMLLGNYPMTQVYQHEEDARHGDRTISLMLGIRGTFIFVQVIFSLVAMTFVFYFRIFFRVEYGYVFLVALFPVVLYFGVWFYKVLRDETKADFQHTMRLNLISSTCLNAFFIYFYWANHMGVARG